MNCEGGLIFIHVVKEHNIIKLCNDIKNTTFIKHKATAWRPLCLYISPSSGGLLVGMYRSDTDTDTYTSQAKFFIIDYCLLNILMQPNGCV